jgi:hypothetical protein
VLRKERGKKLKTESDDGWWSDASMFCLEEEEEEVGTGLMVGCWQAD